MFTYLVDLEKKNRWRPIAEWPKHSPGTALVFDESVHEAWWYPGNDGHWSDVWGNVIVPTHWMPVPEPPA